MQANLPVFHPYERALGALGLRWRIGSPGPQGSLLVSLDGSPPRQFLLRIVDERPLRSRAHWWSIQLFDPEATEGLLTPVAKAEIVLDAQASDGCTLRLTGIGETGGGTPVSNAYARSLLDQLDRAVSMPVGSR